MIKINERLMGIRPDEMIELTNETRKILLFAYLSRRIRPPFWVIAPSEPRKTTGEATSAPKSRLGTIGLLSQI